MTIDAERWERIRWARLFLQRLADDQAYDYSPRSIREEASRLLKHYPEPWWVDEQEKPRRALAAIVIACRAVIRAAEPMTVAEMAAHPALNKAIHEMDKTLEKLRNGQEPR